jgi:cell division protein FtsW (lipid II flippase)
MGLIPTTGIGLPFISYGGSSLISYYIMMGIFLNLTKNKAYEKQ